MGTPNPMTYPKQCEMNEMLIISVADRVTTATLSWKPCPARGRGTNLDGIGVPVLQSSVPQFARAFLALIPELAERIEIISAPRRFRNILVPGASFVIAREAHVEFKRMCERMAWARDDPFRARYRSAALSVPRRSQFECRTLEGETWLERSLEREGFLIVRPETLPVAEQIALVNRHRWIISAAGLRMSYKAVLANLHKFRNRYVRLPKSELHAL